MHIPVQLSLSQISCVTSTYHCFNAPYMRKELHIHASAPMWAFIAIIRAKTLAPWTGNIQCLDTKPSLRSGNLSQQCGFNFQVLVFVQNYKTHTTRQQRTFNKNLASPTSRTLLLFLITCLQLLFPYYKPTILYRTVTFRVKAADFIGSINYYYYYYYILLLYYYYHSTAIQQTSDARAFSHGVSLYYLSDIPHDLVH